MAEEEKKYGNLGKRLGWGGPGRNPYPRPGCGGALPGAVARRRCRRGWEAGPRRRRAHLHAAQPAGPRHPAGQEPAGAGGPSRQPAPCPGPHWDRTRAEERHPPGKVGSLLSRRQGSGSGYAFVWEAWSGSTLEWCGSATLAVVRKEFCFAIF